MTAGTFHGGGTSVNSVHLSTTSQPICVCYGGQHIPLSPGLLHAVISTAELLHSGHTHSFTAASMLLGYLTSLGFFFFPFCLKNLLFNKAVQGRPVGLNTEHDEPAGVTDNTNSLFFFFTQRAFLLSTGRKISGIFFTYNILISTCGIFSIWDYASSAIFKNVFSLSPYGPSSHML